VEENEPPSRKGPFARHPSCQMMGHWRPGESFNHLRSKPLYCSVLSLVLFGRESSDAVPMGAGFTASNDIFFCSTHGVHILCIALVFEGHMRTPGGQKLETLFLFLKQEDTWGMPNYNTQCGPPHRPYLKGLLFM
jgi:hypothetical protein